MAEVLFPYPSMHLLAGDELSLECSRGDNFDPFYGGPNSHKTQTTTSLIEIENRLELMETDTTILWFQVFLSNSNNLQTDQLEL